MAEFRFRAAAALELRKQQETAASTALARAEALLREAEARVQQAARDRQTAQETQRSAERRGTDAGTIEWHRNWIVRLTTAVDALARDVEARALAVTQAEQQWREARRRRLTLERMRERAWRRYQQEQQRQELKVIDELARLRFVMADAWRDDT
ncbi:MAG TPA: flagellar FliJ family protein [Vicinamibacterales bacterium]|jgi:flagellar export protein FliJ|nr:flagellar FliJ family protein [Vicinamibacterales bacterium]